MADNNSWSGVSDQEAQEFHSFYLQGTFLFVAVAVVAHILVWLWRPWIPPAGGYKAAFLDGATTVLSAVQTFIA
jgi:light-harvesting complex 1 beta chain